MRTSFGRAGYGWVLAVFAGLACASPVSPPARFDFSQPLAAEDLWQPKIRLWQAARHGDSLNPDVALAQRTPLGQEYVRFESELRVEVVQRVLRWVQLYSGLYFRLDEGVDYWPTLSEVIAAGGDDCDGMDVLTFELLRRLGFRQGELYRAVLFQRKREIYHMVTLWFPEESRDDPYVLDPSGEVSHKVLRLSQASDWEPVAMFDESAQFRVELRGASGE